MPTFVICKINMRDIYICDDAFYSEKLKILVEHNS